MIRQWFEALPRREQLLLAGVASLVLVYLLIALVWSPLAESRAQLETTNSALRSDLVRIEALASRYRNLQQAGAPAADGRSLPALIDETVRRNGLVMGRFQPGATGDVQLRFDDAGFDNLVRWLHELRSQHGVSVRELSVSPGSEAGLVSASVRLYRG